VGDAAIGGVTVRKPAIGRLRAVLYGCALCSGACGQQVAPHQASVAVAPGCMPSHDGYLRLRMRGESNMDIDWHDVDMQCGGGPRPGQQGLRLTFAGPVPGAAHGGALAGTHTLRFVFGIAAAPGVRSGHNVPANVTVIFEGERKLFSTAGDGRCTIDEFSEQPLPAPAKPNMRRLAARGFCTAPATALAGGAQLLVSRFDFAGPVIDEDPADAPPPATP
jgi:hypothetical protein